MSGHNAGGDQNELSDEISGGESAGAETMRDMVMGRSAETRRSATLGAGRAPRCTHTPFGFRHHNTAVFQIEVIAVFHGYI